jgi:hypothetical protein
MGVWFENFALPAVINECLMQGYKGTIRLFPNWPAGKDAEFHKLRAAGAFLVSASLKNGKVEYIRIRSEAGGQLNIILPWEKGAKVSSNEGTKKMTADTLIMNTVKGEELLLKPL